MLPRMFYFSVVSLFLKKKVKKKVKERVILPRCPQNQNPKSKSYHYHFVNKNSRVVLSTYSRFISFITTVFPSYITLISTTLNEQKYEKWRIHQQWTHLNLLGWHICRSRFVAYLIDNWSPLWIIGFQSTHHFHQQKFVATKSTNKAESPVEEIRHFCIASFLHCFVSNLRQW